MDHLVIAYPELHSKDYNAIQDCRRVNDRLYKLIEPHFTYVFAVGDYTTEAFCAEVRKQVAGFKTIPFSIRCATINKDSFSEHYFAFLVPDEGFSQNIMLHDRLYAGSLAPHRRLDIDYIPHIEIANSLDPQFIKSIVDEWNDRDFTIQGTISAIDIVTHDHKAITTVERIQLK